MGELRGRCAGAADAVQRAAALSRATWTTASRCPAGARGAGGRRRHVHLLDHRPGARVQQITQEMLGAIEVQGLPTLPMPSSWPRGHEAPLRWRELFAGRRAAGEAAGHRSQRQRHGLHAETRLGSRRSRRPSSTAPPQPLQAAAQYVLYVHSKGSTIHPTKPRAEFEGAGAPSWFTLPSGAGGTAWTRWTGARRLRSPVERPPWAPWTHWSGNWWWATCDHLHCCGGRDRRGPGSAVIFRDGPRAVSRRVVGARRRRACPRRLPQKPSAAAAGSVERIVFRRVPGVVPDDRRRLWQPSAERVIA